MQSETKAKIEKHIRKHRASGGKAEAHEQHAKGKGSESADKGDDSADADLAMKPNRRNNAPKIQGAAEEKSAKKGGRIKRAYGGAAKDVGAVSGAPTHHHAGRKSRASGGSCEANPFTSAMAGKQPSGRSVMRESTGLNH